MQPGWSDSPSLKRFSAKSERVVLPVTQHIQTEDEPRQKLKSAAVHQWLKSLGVSQKGILGMSEAAPSNFGNHVHAKLSDLEPSRSLDVLISD